MAAAAIAYVLAKEMVNFTLGTLSGTATPELPLLGAKATLEKVITVIGKRLH